MNKILIVAVLGALLIIGGAVMFVKSGGNVPGSSDTPAMEFSGESVIVTEYYQSCADNDRCIVIDSHCGFCCDYTTINARFENDFDQAFNKSCRRFTGSYCNCFDLSSYPSCVEGKCQLIDWPDDSVIRPPANDAPQRPQPAPPVTQTEQPAPFQPPAPDPVTSQPAILAPSQEANTPEPEAQPTIQQPPIDRGFDTLQESNGLERDESLFAPLPESLPENTPRAIPLDDPLNRPLPSGDL